MIAYAFPPTGGSGVQRPLKFAKYLPQNGWLPIVLTSKGKYGGYGAERDQLLTSEFPPEGQVYRAPVLDPLKPLRRFWRSDVPDTEIAQERPTPSRSMKQSILHSARRLWQTWVYIPDDYIGWFLPALRKARRIMREHQIDVIYSTSDPLTDHLIAYFLAWLTNKPWVADFRDPWTCGAHYAHKNTARHHLDRWLERQFLLKAAVIAVTSDATAAQFREKHSGVDPNKFETITNGFDEEDSSAIETALPIKDNAKLIIVYSGRFAGEKNSSPWFLHALSQLVKTEPTLRKHIEVWFVGLFDEQNKMLVEQLGLDEVVRTTGYVCHRDALGYLFQADALLLTLNPSPGNEVIILGKTFEYLKARKPILALVPEGATAQLVRETDSGIIVAPDDVTAIKSTLYDMYRQHKQGRLSIGRCPSLDRFSRKHLTRRLATLFDALIQ